MTTAIIAKNYEEARLAAGEYGIGHDWLYPHDEQTLKGVKFDRIMFVAGYAEGGVTVEIARTIYEQATATAPVVHYELGTSDFDRIIAPFVEPADATDDYTPRHAARDKRKALAILAGATIGSGIGVALVALAVINGMLP